MKKLIILATIFLVSNTAISQVELSPMFGYTVSGKASVDGGYLNIKSDISYGGLVDIHVGMNGFVELSYRRSTPEVVEEGFIGDYGEFESGIEHYQLGFGWEFDTSNDQVLPFAMFSLGASRYFGRGEYNYDTALFSGVIGGGVKIFFSENVGIRFQTNLTMPSAFGGTYMYCGWYGCAPVSNYYIPFVHWDTSLGLIFKID